MNPIIQKTFDQVRSLFIYIPDKEQFPEKWDDWRSYANQVELGQIFKDDCDAFAMTCAELLVRRLIPNCNMQNRNRRRSSCMHRRRICFR